MLIIDINKEKRECVAIAPDKNFAGYMKVRYKSRFRPNHEYFEWYSKEDFVKNNPKLSYLIKGASEPWKEDLGVVSLASSITLTDKSKKWEANEFAGYPLWISRGRGEGQTRKINMNSDTTLIIDKPWVMIPDKTSQYVISHNVHNPQIMGNTLPEKFKLSKKRKHTKILEGI
jgi:hypothetical protein